MMSRKKNLLIKNAHMIVSDILNATPRPTLARLVLVQPDQLHAWVIEKRVAAVILK